jgi:hypothetical protein
MNFEVALAIQFRPINFSIGTPEGRHVYSALFVTRTPLKECMCINPVPTAAINSTLLSECG